MNDISRVLKVCCVVKADDPRRAYEHHHSTEDSELTSVSIGSIQNFVDAL